MLFLSEITQSLPNSLASVLKLLSLTIKTLELILFIEQNITVHCMPGSFVMGIVRHMSTVVVSTDVASRWRDFFPTLLLLLTADVPITVLSSRFWPL